VRLCDIVGMASGAGQRLFRTECARSISQENLRSNEIAELRHRDASQHRRVVTQGEPLQSVEGIARAPAAGISRLWNPATLVTPTFRQASPIYVTTPDERSKRHDDGYDR
jgi:hypothetical protein